MAKAYQVIKFVLLDFGENWSRSILATGIVEYKPGEGGASLAVVFESASGAMGPTYRFRVIGEPVYVDRQVVHVPARCLKQEPGNTVKCEG